MVIPMKYKFGQVLLGDLTNGMFISSGKRPFYKDTLLNMGEFDLEPYTGSETIELTDFEFNDLTRDYFRLARKPDVYRT